MRTRTSEETHPPSLALGNGMPDPEVVLAGGSVGTRFRGCGQSRLVLPRDAPRCSSAPYSHSLCGFLDLTPAGKDPVMERDELTDKTDRAGVTIL